MDESFNYNEHFEKCFSPAVSDISPHPILEFYGESWRGKKSGIENVDVIDDAQSKLQSVELNSQMDKALALIPISRRYGSELKLVEHEDEVQAPILIRGGEGFDSKLLDYVEPIHKALAPPKIICSKEKSHLEIDQETGQPSNAKDEVKKKRIRKKRHSNSAKHEAKDKGKRKKKQSSNVDGDSWLAAGRKKIVKYRKTGKPARYTCKIYREPGENIIFRSKTQAKAYIEEQKSFEADRDSRREKKAGIENADVIDDAQLVEKNSQMEKESDIIGNVRGSELMLLASAEHLDNPLAPTPINRLEGSETKLQGYVEPVDEVLAPTLIRGGPLKIICSKEKSSIEIDQEAGQPSNAKDEVKEKRTRKKRKSNSAKDEAKEKKKKKKQTSNADGDSWLPAGWEKIVKYRKTGKLAGYAYKLYREPSANITFRSKTQAKTYIEEQKSLEAKRGRKFLEYTERGVQAAEDIQTISINDQVITSLSEISGIGGDVVMLNGNT